jgi:hypothetical protein
MSKRRRSHTAILRDLKRAGKTRHEVEQLIQLSVTDAAKAQGWRTSELVMTLADWHRALARVFGLAS